MKKNLFFLLLITGPCFVMAQPGAAVKDTSWKKIYRASAPKINDLVHTKLDVKFDYDRSWLYGKEWLTLKPHFYSTDSLTLDAKGMDIKEVSMMKGSARSALKFQNDGMELRIKLDRTYKGGEAYTIYIDYTAKPNEVKQEGSAAITDAKGLYFINPKGEVKNKPTQIWTQGETEANSCWMPTIDKPDQKTTDEIYMTVPAKYVTLSNGKLVSQKKNADGTRTDYWKMDLPHSPYLFFMGVGDYAIIKDSYKGKEVSYYVEKDQAPFARGVFGYTPEMIKFYSEKLGIDYPWQKYSQIVGRDYVSGAMENTTATLHQENAYQNNRQLADGNRWETVICHELFHQWFGDLVTAESWSNLTVNESMADYSETLWMEYKHSKDAGDEANQQGLNAYLAGANDANKNLVRFQYADKEDMFDRVTYQKGGRVHHMLRSYVGDEAYYKALNNYLTANKFKNGESQQMRLAFEEVTGQDLNWFWNQWFMGNGNPTVKIDYVYNDAAGKASVIIEQTQKTDKVFRLPLAIDVYTGAVKKRYNVWAENKVDTFTFDYSRRPDLINVDANKVMLWKKTDNKSAENFIAQWKNAPLYLDRREALEYFAKNEMKELAEGLKDKYSGLRTITLGMLLTSKFANDPDVLKAVEALANTEKDKVTKATALVLLAKTKDAKYLPLFKANVNDLSYSVSAAALEGIKESEPATAYTLAKQFSNDAKGDLSNAVIDAITANGSDADFDLMLKMYEASPRGKTTPFAEYLGKINNVENVKKGIDAILKYRNSLSTQFRGFAQRTFKNAFDKLGAVKGKEIQDYINERMK